MSAHEIDRLRQRHGELEAMIDAEEKFPLPDEASITRWKKEKLRIKDEIARLEREAAQT